MHFLLTRPQQDNRRLRQALVALGHRVDCAPVITITYYDRKPIDITPFQAMLFTSANGVRAFALNSSVRNIPCFAVGPATAREAADCGFQTIFTAGGNVDRLAGLVQESLDPATGPLLHISGRDIAGDLAALLGQAGFSLSREQLYQAEKTPRLPREILDLMAAGSISHIPLYSPRSAGIFGGLVRDAGQENCLKQITAVCLSPAVANMVKSLPWREILTAKYPNQTSLFQITGITLKEDRQ